LRGARVVIAPGRVLDQATVVMRDGRIADVGQASRISIPSDARVWDGAGLTVYAGFIDAYVERAFEDDQEPRRTDGSEADPGLPGPGADLVSVRAQRRAVDGLAPTEELRTELRRLGFTAAGFVPAQGVLRGTVAVLGLGDVSPNQAVLAADAAMAASFESGGWGTRTVPSSTMGAVAVLRQTVLDARRYQQDWADYEKRPDERERPAYDPALAAMQPLIERRMPLLLVPTGILMEHRAAQLARELQIDLALRSNGEEWRRPDLVDRHAVPLIVPLAFPDAPELDDEQDWVQVGLDELRAWDWAPENPAVVERLGVPFALTTHGLKDRAKTWGKRLAVAHARGLSHDAALAALTVVPASLYRLQDRLGTVEVGKIANLTVLEGALLDPKAKVRAVWVEGRCYELPSLPEKPAQRDAEQEGAAADSRDDAAAVARVAREPYADRGPAPTPPAVLVRNATIWTSGPQGRLEGADLLARGGKVVAVGAGLSAPANALVIDARGKHVTPGLIDCHSHAMIVGDVNESVQSCTAEVRIEDVVNSETRNIYLELAGGLTCANLLHGSANAIGGQSQVVKLRWGAGPDGLKLAGAKPGIKFALGENPKRGNSPAEDRTRYPGTRMGVEQLIRERFAAAADYARGWDEFRTQRKGKGVPPRRDLELDALVEILRGERLIHCHSYRQDEILALIRLMDELGVRIGTFQHVLEGYKVADEIAAHGAGASSFSDWWAYKFEVYDAIPYSGSIMRERGVLVSYNSDSPDLSRRMNLEVAKAVKYGGTSEEDALAFVTINPARQLRIESRVGSLEPGKDADFVIWSGHPLATTSRCEQTWIEGAQYFDLTRDAQIRDRAIQERDALVAKAREAAKRQEKKADRGEASGAGARPGQDGGGAWAGIPYRVPQELQWEGQSRGCLDGAHLHAQEAAAAASRSAEQEVQQ
jgi:imidazolonepropionase-like amidohydrolase